MRPRISLATFRKVGRLEEQMIRAAMPRTSMKDVEPLPAYHAPTQAEVNAKRQALRLVRPVPTLTFTLAEARLS